MRCLHIGMMTPEDVRSGEAGGEDRPAAAAGGVCGTGAGGVAGGTAGAGRSPGVPEVSEVAGALAGVQAESGGAGAIIVNGRSRALPVPATVVGLLDELGLSRQPAAVEVNLELVPKRQHAARALVAGDRIEVVTLVGGG